MIRMLLIPCFSLLHELVPQITKINESNNYCFFRFHSGPLTWTNVAPAAKGLHQSPVDIETQHVHYDPQLSGRPLFIQYVPQNSKTLLNNGHSVQVAIDGTGSRKCFKQIKYCNCLVYTFVA